MIFRKFSFSIFFVLSLLFLSSGISFAQSRDSASVKVSFKITNQRDEPVGFTTLTIVHPFNGTTINTIIADSAGRASILLHSDSQYIIRASSINYQPTEKGIRISGSQPAFTISMEPVPKTLEGVVIRSQKPLIRQEDDMTIVDPENLASSSTSSYEVIEKTPGLFVDQDGNIYISSMTPASVYINGREMKMSTADIATMLKSLPPNAIERIEILRTPSAKFDASGSGGVVNVVLKKGVKIGQTGSVSAGMHQGTYGTRFVGFSLNNNDGKKSSYVNFNYNRRNTYDKIVTDRFFAVDTMLSQHAFTRYQSSSYFTSYGINFSLGNQWDLDFAGSATLNDFDNNTDNQSVIRKISNSQTITDNLNKVNNNGYSLTFSNGIEFKKKIDSAGSDWVNDIYFNYNRGNTDQLFATGYYSPVMPVTGGDGKSENKRSFLTVKSDLKLKFKKSLTIETGLKASFQQFNSLTNYFSESGGTRVKDPSRTNTFRYSENINSLYAQGSKTFSGFVLKAGLRLENTNMKGHQLIPSDTSFTIDRTDLFPYVYLSRKLMSIAGFEMRAYLVYRRSISRPVYEQLNPFPRYIDQYLSEIGNPRLKPQFTTNYEANISVDERPILAVGYNDTRDIFTNVIYQADSTQSQAYRTYDNLGSNKEWYFRGMGAIPPGKTYFFVVVAQYNYTMYDGLYQGSPLSFRKGTWTFFTYHMLKLGKRSQFSMNGFMRLKGQQQLYVLGKFGALNASLNRRFLKEKLVVTLSLNDIFASNKNNFTITQGPINATGFRQSDTRRFGINLRYNFGIRKKEETPGMFNVENPG